MAGRRSSSAKSTVTSYTFLAPYLGLLLAFGLVPAGYAIYESLTDTLGGTGPAGLTNYRSVFDDFRFWPGVGHVGLFMLIWIPIMVGGSLFFALLLHERIGRFSSAMRLVFFLPGAVTGSAAVLLWYFMLSPELSPFGPMLRIMGWHTDNDMFSQAHLPYIFAVVAFMTGVGSWIVIMFGAMQAIPQDTLEAAKVDGAGAIRTAWSIKLPLVKKYIVYMLILCFAAALQIFVEPMLFFSITNTGSLWWSLNQLGYTFAFSQGEFGEAATVSVILLVVSSAAALIFVLTSNFFQTEVDE